MKSDALFYELFKIEPESLFELVKLDIEGEYTFESITTKTTEKRFDGFFRRTDGDGPDIFLEIQGYDDPKIYWRLFREICTRYEQTEDCLPFTAIVLFTDEKYDPGNCPLCCAYPSEIVRANLGDCLSILKDKAGVLTVLKPFGLSDSGRLPESVPEWKAEIESLGLPEHKTKKLTELLEYLILQCFPKLTLKEVQMMTRLTPLEETVAGQELIQIGIKQGIEQGIEKGELIGKIQLMQSILKGRQSAKTTLLRKSVQELKELLKKLEKISDIERNTDDDKADAD